MKYYLIQMIIFGDTEIIDIGIYVKVISNLVVI